jgi:hypothetical protein
MKNVNYLLFLRIFRSLEEKHEKLPPKWYVVARYTHEEH